METRLCEECGAILPKDLTDVFCPACALRGALAEGEPHGASWWVRWFRWFQGLLGRKQDDKSREKPLAYEEDAGGHSPPMTAAAPTPGEVIGDYEILERIGGNMGFVFKARHRLLEKVVVLKLVPADCIADPAVLVRFQRELRAMGQLKHPNLVTASDARSVGAWHLVAMEFIDGVDLQQLVRTRGALPVEAACEAARQTALGLQYAHEHGLIHRDIKPSNLMVTRAGIIKVIDMGLALIREDSTAQVTQSGHMLGTVSYCAPEQIRSPSHVDIRADIYSLGCTLYNLLTGRSPYWQRKPMEVIQAHLHEPFPSLLQSRTDAPAQLEAVLARMIAKDREARFSTPSEVVEALEPFARGADLSPLVPAATLQDPPRRASAGQLSPTPEREHATSQGQPKALWPRLAALLVLLLAIAGAVVLAVNRPKANTIVNRETSDSAAVPVDTNWFVVFMDTTAGRGVYDEETRNSGGSNAEVLSKVIRDDGMLPAQSLYADAVGPLWSGWAAVRIRRPHVVVIHRSVFSHLLIAHLGLGYPPFFGSDADEKFKMWRKVYYLGDEKLREFMGYVGQVPRTQFLIYSRGTDTNWLDMEFRQKWAKDVEVQFPELEGRVDTMLIPNGTNGTFKDPETAKELLKRLKDLLDKSAK